MPSLHLKITENNANYILSRDIDPQKITLNHATILMNAEIPNADPALAVLFTNSHVNIDIPWLHSSIYHNIIGNNQYITLGLDIEKRYTSTTPFLDLYPHNIPRSFNITIYGSDNELLTTFTEINLYFTFNDL
jgi:hypothetical protein